MAINDLARYIPIINFFAEFSGPNVEVILSDTATRQIVHVANPFSETHAVGAPMDEVEQKFMETKIYTQKDAIMNYRSFSHDRKKLRSATYFLKDEQGLAGMLTINYRVTDLIEARSLIDEIINGINPGRTSVADLNVLETHSQNFEDLMSSSIQNAVNHYPVPPERLSIDEKLEIIRTLHEQGTFLIKGSVAEVAKVLNSSEPTIYRYIRELFGNTD